MALVHLGPEKGERDQKRIGDDDEKFEPSRVEPGNRKVDEGDIARDEDQQKDDLEGVQPSSGPRGSEQERRREDQEPSQRQPDIPVPRLVPTLDPPGEDDAPRMGTGPRINIGFRISGCKAGSREVVTFP